MVNAEGDTMARVTKFVAHYKIKPFWDKHVYLCAFGLWLNLPVTWFIDIDIKEEVCL